MDAPKKPLVDLRELLHAIIRRNFEDEVLRHFVGEVESGEGTVARVRGYAPVFDGGRNEYVKRPELRTWLIALADNGNSINILPPTVQLNEFRY